MGLESHEYQGGRQIKRGDTTLDILDTVQGNGGGQFVFARSGDTVEIIPVASLREEESDYQAVDEEERQADLQRQEDERRAQEAKDEQEFRDWQASRQQDADERSAWEAQRGGQPENPNPQQTPETPHPSA